MLSFASPLETTARSAIGNLVAAATNKIAASVSFGDYFKSIGPEEVEATDETSDASLTELQESLQTRSATLQQAIGDRLRAAGISLDGSLAVEFDSRGDLRVEGAHVSASQIELLLSTDESLRQQAADLHAIQGEVEQLELAQRADRLRDIDPRAAADLLAKARDRSGSSHRLIVE